MPISTQSSSVHVQERTRRVRRVSTGVKIDARKYYAAVEIYLKSQFKRSFTKMIVTRAGRLLE